MSPPTTVQIVVISSRIQLLPKLLHTNYLKQERTLIYFEILSLCKCLLVYRNNRPEVRVLKQNPKKGRSRVNILSIKLLYKGVIYRQRLSRLRISDVISAAALFIIIRITK